MFSFINSPHQWGLDSIKLETFRTMTSFSDTSARSARPHKLKHPRRLTCYSKKKLELQAQILQRIALDTISCIPEVPSFV